MNCYIIGKYDEATLGINPWTFVSPKKVLTAPQSRHGSKNVIKKILTKKKSNIILLVSGLSSNVLVMFDPTVG